MKKKIRLQLGGGNHQEKSRDFDDGAASGGTGGDVTSTYVAEREGRGASICEWYRWKQGWGVRRCIPMCCRNYGGTENAKHSKHISLRTSPLCSLPAVAHAWRAQPRWEGEHQSSTWHCKSLLTGLRKVLCNLPASSSREGPCLGSFSVMHFAARLICSFYMNNIVPFIGIFGTGRVSRLAEVNFHHLHGSIESSMK